MYSIGDWVQYTLYPGSTPMLVANIMADDTMLCSVSQYGGDWKIVSPLLVKKIDLSPEKALSLMSDYGGWFYNHQNLRTIYQQTIVIALKSRRCVE